MILLVPHYPRFYHPFKIFRPSTKRRGPNNQPKIDNRLNYVVSLVLTIFPLHIHFKLNISYETPNCILYKFVFHSVSGRFEF